MNAVPVTQAPSDKRRGLAAGTIGKIAVLLALSLLVIVLARWQVETWQWPTPDRQRLLAAAAILAAYTGFVIVLGHSRRRAAEATAAANATHAGADGGPDWLVVHASQFGQAEVLAQRTAQSLHHAGQRARLVGIAQLDADALQSARRVLFVASTTGEGDAPDPAARFVSRCMGQDELRLEHLEYAVLALGDRDYQLFCAFGQHLDTWLRSTGARALFDLVEVDDGDPGALRHWQYLLGQFSGGGSDQSDWARPSYRSWTLDKREQLNPGSPGGAVFDLALAPLETGMDWQAGDVAEIGPRHGAAAVGAWLARTGLSGDAVVKRNGNDADPITLTQLAACSRLPNADTVSGKNELEVAASLQPLPHRAYSIASTPAEGPLRLLVRQVRHPDGALGSGSGWLTAHSAAGDRIDMRIRRNPAFHAPTDDRPLILIGNGTGLAGLRALLRERIEAGHHRNWLLFGERTRAHDFHYRDDIETWHCEGWIEHLDLAFSRDQTERRYVQHLLHERADALHRWFEEGAAVYVCGSLQGMAPAVDAALAGIVGADVLDTLSADGRYRRDVY
ncbi:MAG TPA: sulfite reductase subunit alpha [Lysobacter sp.]|nr:sulfite reductase subunit alpha [Lysobacter sp.]